MTWLMAFVSGCLIGLLMVASMLGLKSLTVILFKGQSYIDDLGLGKALFAFVLSLAIPGLFVGLSIVGLQRTLDFPLGWAHGLLMLIGFLTGMSLATGILMAFGISLPAPNGETP